MPAMALDILPPRPEVAPSTDTGYKPQGMSSGKNEGPSFSEVLEKASQNDTTDGKTRESDRISQEKDENQSTSELSAKEERLSTDEKKLPSESEKTKSFKNQILESKDSSENPVDQLLQEASLLTEKDAAPEPAEALTAKTLKKDSSSLVSKQAHARNEKIQEKAEKTPVLAELQKSSGDELLLEKTKEKLVLKNDELPKKKIPSEQSSFKENALLLKTSEEASSENREVKKDKKSRFSEYDILLAGLSRNSEKEASVAELQQPSAFDEAFAAAPGIGNQGLAGEKIQVLDLRTGEQPVEKGESKGFVKELSFDDKGNAQVSLSLMPSKEGASSSELVDGIAKKDFASMLSRELESSAGELVKTGSIVLQNNNKGSINLILHPEELGNVKIKLELSENQVSGKIVVASQEAFEAFKESISAIKEAFSASGFETGGFELAWGGNGNGGSQDQSHQRQEFVQEGTINERGMTYVDSMPDIALDEYAGSGNVNLVA